jgi:hypothetical protein
VETVASALTELVQTWYGKKYGSTRALVNEVRSRTGKPVGDHRLYRELKSRPTWEVVEWVVDICVRGEVTTSESSHSCQEQLECLAGLWWREHHNVAPLATLAG